MATKIFEPEVKVRRRKQARFTDEQKYEIVLDLLAGRLSHPEICRQHGVSSTYAYKLRDRGHDILKSYIGSARATGSTEIAMLTKKVEDLARLAGEQALLIKSLRSTRGSG